MIWLIGWKTIIKRLWTGLHTCRRCLGHHPHDLQERTEWGTLFFVPLVPLRRERILTCSYCGLETRLSKAETGQFMEMAGPPDLRY
jgi:hypothetical protein